EDVQHAGEVVAERHQAPLAAHLVKAAHQEVAVTGPAFERAERMLDQAGTLAHPCPGLLHPRAMTLDHRFMLPAIDRAPWLLVRQAALAQRTGVTDRLQADITDLAPPTGVDLEAVHRLQQLTRWALIRVGFRVIDKSFVG